MRADLIIKHARQLVTSQNSSEKPKTGGELRELKVIADGAVAVSGETIAAVGTTAEVMAAVEVAAETKILDASGKTVLPGLVDPHTHLVFGGSRENELDLKLKGVPYLEILARGGGILSTVEATRKASKEELVEAGMKYAGQMLAQGTTTAEAKSGYGLTPKDEIKILEAIREINQRHPLDLAPTFLGAHAVPREYRENSDRYLDLVIEEMIPRVAAEGLAEFCDVFCEQGVFNVGQSERVLRKGLEKGLAPKIHADEIVPLGGAEMAAELQAASADHLLVISGQGIKALAAKQVMAVILPGTTFYLKEKHYAPVRRMIEEGVPLALASDFNPGSCPNNSLQMIMTIACLYLNMTPREVVNAVTINAAHAINRAKEIGSLEVGKQADIVIFDAPNYQYLPYRFGSNLVQTVVKKGQIVVGTQEDGHSGEGSFVSGL